MNALIIQAFDAQITIKPIKSNIQNAQSAAYGMIECEYYCIKWKVDEVHTE